MADVQLELEWIEHDLAATQATKTLARRRLWMPWAVAAALAAALIAALLMPSPKVAVGIPVQFEQPFRWYERDMPMPAVSPDGRMLAFLSQGAAGALGLWTRRLDRREAEPLSAAGNANFPFWSPDSRLLGYLADREIRVIDPTAATPQRICEAPRDFRGASWGQSGVILLADGAGPLLRVP